jgi:hypothetical protein
MRVRSMVLLLTVSIGTGCSYDEAPCLESGRIRTAISRLVALDSVREFAMADVAPIAWDRMFLFAEYTPAEFVTAKTELEFPKDFLSDSMEHVPEGWTLIVLAKDGTKSPVCYELLGNPSPDRPGGFLFAGPAHRFDGLARAKASFRIVRGERHSELQLLD